MGTNHMPWSAEAIRVQGLSNDATTQNALNVVSVELPVDDGLVRPLLDRLDPLLYDGRLPVLDPLNGAFAFGVDELHTTLSEELPAKSVDAGDGGLVVFALDPVKQLSSLDFERGRLMSDIREAGCRLRKRHESGMGSEMSLR